MWLSRSRAGKLVDRSSAKGRAVHGAIWTIAGYGAGQILRLLSSLLLTRLLFPELYGLMAIAQTVYVGIFLFSDIGLGLSVVRHARGEDPRFLDTVWTIQAIRGFILWLICLAAAPVLATIYAEPRLEWLLPLVGFNAVLMGFCGTSILVMRRRLAAKSLAIFEIMASIVSIAVMIVWALIAPGIGALVAGGMASSLFQLAVSHWLNRQQPNRPHWDAEAVREIITFGKWIFLSTAFAFLSGQADRLILGKLFSLEMLGIYSIAFILADVPRAVMSALSSKVIYPSFAAMAALPREEFRRRIGPSRALLLMVVAAGLALMVGIGDLLVTLLYDPRYHAAGWMLPILAVGIWPALLSQSINPALYVTGNARVGAVGNIGSFFALLGGIVLGWAYFGEFGAVVAVAASSVPMYAANAYGLWREGFARMAQDVWATGLFLALSVAILVARAAFGMPAPVMAMLG